MDSMSSAANSPATKTTISGDINLTHKNQVAAFLNKLGASDPSFLGRAEHTKDYYSDLMRSLLTVDSISPGKVSCSFSVLPCVANGYKGLNGGVVAVVAERVAVACARTVVAENKHLFTGELSLSFLSAAPMNAELIVEAILQRSGRNLTVVSIEFSIKDTKKLMYKSHATFFHISHTPKL
ncbi:hypothetical protein V2J09_002439 [Rumex salicifolius]